jgi:flagellar motor switch protein FliM
MSLTANNLSREKIKQLLSAVGTGQQDDTPDIETAEYNWNQPRYFDRRQLNRLDGLTKRMAKKINLKLDEYFSNQFDVNVVSATQHFAAELVSQTIEKGQNDYYLAFGADQDHFCGLISISSRTSIIWATKLLGDSESEVEDEDRDLSQLEESLVCDLLSALLSTFFQNGLDFQPAKYIDRRHFPLELKGSEELYKIVFGIKKAEQEKSDEVSIVIQSSKLVSVVGKSKQIDRGFSADDISKAILAHMQQMPVFITAQLSSVVLTLSEIMSLEVGDILLLDKKVNEPVEVVTSGRTALLGWPAKSAGKYAIVITELCNDTK